MESTKKPTILCIAIEKGGVGKTTTAMNIGTGLKQLGKQVLLVDLDQQGHLSRWLGWTADSKPTVSELIYQEVSGVNQGGCDAAVRYNEREQLGRKAAHFSQ